ncbi:MAG: FHA domain-containing protein [Caldilineaceae bacterium]
MSAAQTRRKLRIDVFAQHEQQALALPLLKPPALINAILTEFAGIDYLSNNPAHYQLVKTAERTPLDDELPIGEQVADDTQLTLVESAVTPPKGAQRPSAPIYLREVQSGAVYKLHWQPAIIGRPTDALPNNEWIAVNLESYPSGMRVSRRHAQILEEEGAFFVQSLSPNNPLYLRNSAGQETLVTATQTPLHHGDLLWLEGSDITLKFIIRRDE